MNYKNCEIIVYFSGGIDSFYQIKQWEEPFKELNKKHKVLYIITDYTVYLEYLNTQSLEVIFIEDFSSLINFYQNNEFGVLLYINNSLRNFQSIRYSRGYHVHLNHGESEKESMRSNQSQAYDYIFTVGQRGIDRYKEYLLNFNKDKFLKVGRPQLDFIKKMYIKKDKKQKVVLYAPTWEATHPSMNYTSVDRFGVSLTKEVLKNENYIFIYKPHSALGTRNTDVKLAHEEIVALVENSSRAYYFKDENINDVFTIVDFTFFDNTSVMIDYLNTNKPAAYIEVLSDQSINKLSEAFTTINHENFFKVPKILKKELEKDTKKKKRNTIKKYYLGDYKEGESTKIFINEISSLLQKRERKINKIKK